MNEKWRKIIFDGHKILYSTLNNLQGQYVVKPKKSLDNTIIVCIEQTRQIENDDTESLISVYNTALHMAYHSLNMYNFMDKWFSRNPNDVLKQETSKYPEDINLRYQIFHMVYHTFLIQLQE